jgi:hypothetical protein
MRMLESNLMMIKEVTEDGENYVVRNFITGTLYHKPLG